MKIYLVRHGECNSNLNKVYNSKNEDLNETGIKQANDLKEKIKDIKFDIVYSSPMLRAIHTAEILNVNDGVMIVDERIAERDPGSLEGQAYETTDRNEYWNYYTDIKYGTEERIPEFFNRIKGFLDELKTKNYGSVLIVAHGGVAKAFYAYFKGIPEDGKFLKFGLKNTGLVEYILN